MTTARRDRRLEPLPRPPASADAGPARRALPRRSSRPASGGSSRPSPLSARGSGIHASTTASPTRAATRSSSRSSDERAHLGAIEAIDPAELSAAARFERDLELHNVRRELFDLDELRHLGAALVRRSTRSAMRSSCCSPATTRRSPSGSTRSPAGSRARRASSRRRRPARRSRRSAAGRSSRSRRRTACPACSTSSSRPATGVLGGARGDAAWSARWRRPGPRSRPYAEWLRGTLADGTDDWPIGRERHDALVAHRAFDGLDADADPGARLAEAGRGEGRPRRRGPRDRPGRRRGRGPGPDQGRPPGRLRGRARALPRRRCCARGST